jgi:acyl dehydratase
MPLNAKAVLAHRFAPIGQTLFERDAMLYALSLGIGRDPLDRAELPYVYEKGLRVFPTLAVVLGHPGGWADDPALRIDRQMLVHGTQRLTLHRPLPVGVPLVAQNRVVEVLDKGADAGAVIVIERTITHAASGELLAVLEAALFCRADGGFGGPRTASYEFTAVPDTPADLRCAMPTDASSALLYRLNGDWNPLHADPAFAAGAGFGRPILHGLCTYGIAAHALSRHFGFPHGRTLRSIEARFSKPMFPGETLEVEMWQRPGGIAFRARAAERGAVVLDRGLATFE